MQITALKKQVRRPDRVNVFVDGKYALSLSFDQLVTHKVSNGQELDAKKLKSLQKISTDGKLREGALAWLLIRPHSERELRDYLRRKKAADELTEKIVAEFTQKKYLNDQKFAHWLTELRIRGGRSNRAIKSELFAKGVSREVIDDSLGLFDDESERLQQLIAKKRQTARYQKDESKLKQYLVQQGYSYSLVKEILK